jgi:hypothetical protein
MTANIIGTHHRVAIENSTSLKSENTGNTKCDSRLQLTNLVVPGNYNPRIMHIQFYGLLNTVDDHVILT